MESAPMDQVSQFLNVLRGQLGYVEKRGNHTKYGAELGVDGRAWCAIVMVWGLLRIQPVIDLRHISTNPYYTPTLFHDLSNKIPEQDMQPGDLVFYDFPNDGINRIQHVGACEVAPNRNGNFQALEGNTSFGGSQYNGGAFLRRGRNLSSVRGVARPPWSHAPAPEHPPFHAVPRTGVFKGNQGRLVQCLQWELSALCGPIGSPADQAAWDAEGASQTYREGTQWRVGLFINVLILNNNRKFQGHPTELVSPDLFQAIDFLYWLKTGQQPLV